MRQLLDLEGDLRAPHRPRSCRSSRWLSAAPLGCGGDREERGLAPPNESATPDSPAADAETEAERQKQVVDQMEAEQHPRRGVLAQGACVDFLRC
jgi:hypothetical protein